MKKLTDKFDKAIVLEAVISDDVHNEDVFIHGKHVCMKCTLLIFCVIT